MYWASKIWMRLQQKCDVWITNVFSLFKCYGIKVYIFFDNIYETFYIHKQIPPSQWTWIYLLAYYVDKKFFSVVAPSSLVINMNLLYLHSCHLCRYAYLGKVLCSPFQIADMYQNKIQNIFFYEFLDYLVIFLIKWL